MAIDKIILSDRIKEISHSTGTGNFRLEGAATGFSALSGNYTYNDAIYYAITDGTDYEVGSGVYHQDGSNPAISRFPFDSSNNDSKVNFGAGVKEVFVTYPGKHAVFSAGGLSTHQTPVVSGLAFWGSSQILDYSSDLTWNTSKSKLGVLTRDPQYAIDVRGSDNNASTIRSSGMIIGDSGIMFSGITSAGGRQTEPFLRTVLDDTTGTDAVFSLSGIVNQGLLFQKQVKGFVLAGPSSGCSTAECSPQYPTFRYLASGDIPDLSQKYARQYTDGASGNIAFYRTSGVYEYDPYLTWDKTNNRLGLNHLSPAHTLDVDGTAGISGTLNTSGNVVLGSDLLVNKDLTVSGIFHASGDSIFNGNLTVRGTLDAHVSDFKVTADTMTFGDTKHDNLIFNADSAFIANDLHFSGGSIQLFENLGVSGTLNTSGNLEVYKDVYIAGNTTTSGTLNVSGVSFFNRNITTTNNIMVSGTTTASGDAVFGGDLTLDKNFTTSGTLNASGLATFNAGISTSSNTPSGLITQTIVNTSGHMIVPGYATSGDVITAFPPSPPHSGVLAVGGGYLMWCDGTSWLSGIQLA